jgi:ComF family protein
VVAGGVFTGALQDAIHRLKFGNAPWVAAPLTHWATLPDHVTALNVLVPIPLSLSRHRTRGYNQAALVARALGRRANLAVKTHVLVRTRDTAPVAEMKPEQRAETVRGVFAMAKEGVPGLRVGLVDDVVTTSVTVREAARVLMNSGAASVTVLALARGGAFPLP